MQKQSLLRLIDANANRSLEGLRVCEEIMRFHFKSRSHYQVLRRIRHATAQAVRKLIPDWAVLLESRDSRQDVGKRGKSSPAQSFEQLLLINFQRVKEALRVLEESSRIFHPGSASRFQKLRFQAYTAERKVLLYVASLRHR